MPKDHRGDGTERNKDKDAEYQAGDGLPARSTRCDRRAGNRSRRRVAGRSPACPKIGPALGAELRISSNHRGTRRAIHSKFAPLPARTSVESYLKKDCSPEPN